MRKYLVFIPAIILAVGGAGFLLWAQGSADRVNYPDAREYAPNLWFDSEEKYYPSDPLEFYYDENGEELSGKVAVAEYDKLSLEEKLGKIKVFYNINNAGDEIVYQYWLFYVMNNYENGHYGDWESMFVFVDKESKNINKVVGSAHGSGHVLKVKSEDTRHIWAYIGNGSHANCPDEVWDGKCDFSVWNFGGQGFEWTKEDITNGKKIPPADYLLYKLDDLYIGQFQNKKSFNKEKSPTLGVNPYKSLDLLSLPHPKEDKYYNIPLLGKYMGRTPTFAWAKEEYHNPQKVLVSTPTKLANNIAGFFKNSGNFIAGVGVRDSRDRANSGPPAGEAGGQTPVGGLTPSALSELTTDARGLTPTAKTAPTSPASAKISQESANISGKAATEQEIALVSYVIDGDTIELASGERVRYIGIDAPELPDGCFAKEATEQNRALVEGKQITLLSGPTNKDTYDRLLRFVWSGDLFINRALVEGGYAYAVNFTEPHAYTHALESAEAKAKQERLGIFGDACLSSEVLARGGNPEEEQLDVRPQPRVLMYEPPSNPSPSTAPIDSTAPTSTIAVANYKIDNPTFQIQWNTTANDLDYYETQYKIGNSGVWQMWGNATTTATSKNYTNATTSTYYFRVRGTDTNQNIGLWQESQAVVIDLYQVVINEIQVNDSEFVELYNAGSSTTSLAGYYFSYYPSTRTLWNDPFRNKKFPDSASISGAGYYLIGLKNYATSTGNPKADWQPYSSAQLSNEKGTLGIFPFDPTATTSESAYTNRIDAIGWGSGISLYEGVSATTTPAAGQSLTRNSSHADTDNNASDLKVATSTTPTNSKGETYVPPPPPVSPIWAMYQKDARHSGLATLAGPTWTSSAQATTTWVFAMDYPAASSPPVIDGLGVVYAMDGEGKVYAINTNGTQKWKFDPKVQGGNGAGWASASPALSSDGFHIYSTYTDTSVNKLVLYSIHTSDGTFAWKYSPSENGYNQTFTSPVIDSAGNIYVASNTKLYSISSSGSLRWEFTPTSQFSSSAFWIRTPAIAQEGPNEYAYITAQMSLNGGDRYIFKVDVSNGTKAWNSIDSNINNSLFNGVSINATGTIFTGGSKDARIYAINPSDGSKLWERILVSGNVVGPIPNFDSFGNVHVGTSGLFDVGAFNKVSATGTLLWAFTEASPGAVSQPAVVDSQGRVYVGTKDKYIYALKPEDGSVIWKYQLADESRGFAIGNGRVYVASYDGKIYAL